MAEIKVPIQVNLPDDWVEQIVDRLRNDPDAEWVEIIRCKDCKWRHNDNRTRTAWKPCDMLKVSDDWFCADGEREKDG